MKRSPYTYNKLLSGKEDTLDRASDVYSALPLGTDSTRVGEVDCRARTLHDLLDVHTATPDDEEMMLGRNLKLHAQW